MEEGGGRIAPAVAGINLMADVDGDVVVAGAGGRDVGGKRNGLAGSKINVPGALADDREALGGHDVDGSVGSVNRTAHADACGRLVVDSRYLGQADAGSNRRMVIIA